MFGFDLPDVVWMEEGVERHSLQVVAPIPKVEFTTETNMENISFVIYSTMVAYTHSLVNALRDKYCTLQ